MAFNVLVVDDSAVMRAMVIKSLNMSGLPIGEIRQASDGAEALRLLSEHWIDLALIDLNMPIMTGEELLDRVRQNPETADLAVVVVSTESSSTRIAALRQKGAGFVHKPFNPVALRDEVLRITGATIE